MKCAECDYFDKENQECGINERVSPIRKCVIAINKQNIEFLRKESRRMGGQLKLLNIGCGSWCYVKNNLPKNIQWFGIDVEETNKYGKKTIATKMGSVDKIPYPDNFFDFVISDQSIEHWYEFGVSLCKGVNEINRVLKKDGILMLNAPIHFHGHKYFIKGDISKIKKIFKSDFWKEVRFEEWRKEFNPLPSYYGWKGTLHEGLLNKDSSWILEINARKIKRYNLTLIEKAKTSLTKFFLVLPFGLRQNLHLIFEVSPLKHFSFSAKMIKKRLVDKQKVI